MSSWALTFLIIALIISAAETLEQIGQSGELHSAPAALSRLEEAVRELSDELRNQLSTVSQASASVDAQRGQS